MTTARAAVRTFTARREAPGLAADIADLFRSLARALRDPYRPELHYMRGPGPRWHAKRDPACGTSDAIPALVPVRAQR